MQSDDTPAPKRAAANEEYQTNTPKRAMVSDGHEDAPQRAALKIFVLRPVDRQEPPFHFRNTAQVLVIAAESEDAARSLARHENGGEAWADSEMASCEQLAANFAGVIARDMTG